MIVGSFILGLILLFIAVTMINAAVLSARAEEQERQKYADLTVVFDAQIQPVSHALGVSPTAWTKTKECYHAVGNQLECWNDAAIDNLPISSGLTTALLKLQADPDIFGPDLTVTSVVPLNAKNRMGLSLIYELNQYKGDEVHCVISARPDYMSSEMSGPYDIHFFCIGHPQKAWYGQPTD